VGDEELARVGFWGAGHGGDVIFQRYLI
jgi:hypothetical protein